MLFDELFKLRARHGTNDLVNGLAALEQDERGDRADAELAGDRRVVVDVELADADEMSVGCVTPVRVAAADRRLVS